MMMLRGAAVRMVSMKVCTTGLSAAHDEDGSGRSLERPANRLAVIAQSGGGVERLVDDVRVIREARGDVGPKGARVSRRGAGGDDVDLVEVDDHVEILAGGVVDGGRQYATEVAGGR